MYPSQRANTVHVMLMYRFRGESFVRKSLSSRYKYLRSHFLQCSNIHTQSCYTRYNLILDRKYYPVFDYTMSCTVVCAEIRAEIETFSREQSGT